MTNTDADFKMSFRSSASTVQIGMTAGEIVASLQGSCEFFVQFFLGDELTYAVPDFHITSWERLIAKNVEKFALALPRAHAKTTLAKLAVVWYFLFSHVRFIVYVSNTATIASEACQDIINFMRSPNFESVFGPLSFDVEQDARGFYKFRLQYMDETGFMREKYCILRAFGAGQQVRGLNIDNKRPELAIVDDLEDDENTATPALILKLRTWFYGPFYKALANQNKIIYLGNMLSSKSLLYIFCEKSDEWHSMRYGCLKGDGTPLWPDMWPVEKIRKEFIEFQQVGLAGRWFAEMMNMPVADGNLLINSEEIYYVAPILPGQQEYAFITVDPAISLKTWADNSAIVVHAFRDGLWRVADYIVGHFVPDQLFWILVELCTKWNTREVGIEQAAFQAALKFLFEIMSEVNNQHFTVHEIPHRNRPKLERIAVWCSAIRKKQWALQEAEYAITEQLLMFDPARQNNDDDLIDACSMGIIMTELYMGAIMQSYQIDQQQYIPRLGYDVCGI